ncbi:Ferric-chelate reductase 2, partial [Hyphodiscus hymeniophilus]
SLDAPSWYSFISACILALLLLWYGLHRAINSKWPLVTSFIMRHLVYPNIFPRIPFVGTATRLKVLLVSLYLLANFLGTIIGVRADISSRAATMSIINLVPLLCGPRLSLVTNLLGISLRSSIGSHQWFGRTAIAQMLVHMVVSLTESSAFTWSMNSLTGVTQASSALGFIFVLSVRIVRGTLYEWFLNSHLFLAVVVLIALWRHVASKKAAELFLRIGISLWTIATSVHWVLFAFRNFVLGRPSAMAVVSRISNKDESLLDPSNMLQVDVTVARPWRVQAGQFVFLSIPRLGLFTGLRGHPFMISWWERDIRGLKISLLVQSRGGFTAELDRHVNQNLLAFIDGPYGVNYDFGEYGTVIMIATGIGIAAHIPFIKDLISGYNSCTVKTRRIRLVWAIEEKCQEIWVKHWMDELLESDTGYVSQPVIPLRAFY